MNFLSARRVSTGEDIERTSMEKRPALGKGLSALIPDMPEPRASAAPTEVDVDQISPNEHQPRHRFEDGALEELAQSIRANGVIQPIVVRRVDGGYRIIAGERRWRAAQRAGLTRVPVVVKDVAAGSDAQLLEMALIENIQREDLNPIDEAAAYERLSSEFRMTQEEIAAAVGKDRSSVANHMRLLKLPQEVRAEVAGGRLSMGHARALLATADEGSQRQIAREVIARNLSVRETEAMVKRAGREVMASGRRAPAPPDVHTRAAEEKLRMALGTRVRITRKGKGGRIEVDFGNEDELQRLFEHLTT
jgi:ParB family chromosome partitioning protein